MPKFFLRMGYFELEFVALEGGHHLYSVENFTPEIRLLRMGYFELEFVAPEGGDHLYSVENFTPEIRLLQEH